MWTSYALDPAGSECADAEDPGELQPELHLQRAAVPAAGHTNRADRGLGRCTRGAAAAAASTLGRPGGQVPDQEHQGPATNH